MLRADLAAKLTLPILSLALCSLLCACRTPATQVELFLGSDAPAERTVILRVRAFAGSIAPSELSARVAQSSATNDTILVRDPNGANTLTLGSLRGDSIGVLPVHAGDTNEVTLWLQAHIISPTARAPEVVIERTARVGFVRGMRGTGRVFLALRCGDRAVGCTTVRAEACTVSARCFEQNTTCGDQGECVSPDLTVVPAGADGAVTDIASATALDVATGRIADVPDEAQQDASMDVADVAVEDAVDVIADAVDVPCPMGTAAMAGRCVQLAPRPIAPLSLGDVSLRRPTLRWELPMGMDGAELQLCRDRACTMVIETLRTVGTSARPTNPLPANGVVFWRTRATSGVSTGSTYSPTWLFHVPARDNANAVDTSAHAHVDLNGDGYDDVVVGVPNADPNGRLDAGSVRVYHGAAVGISMAPSTVIDNDYQDHERSSFGFCVSGAGDVNGDGFGDLIVGAPFGSVPEQPRVGNASIFLGSPTGVAQEAVALVTGVDLTGGEQFGWSVSGAGDVNGDGYADVIGGARLTWPRGQMNAGSVSVFHGNAFGVNTRAAIVLEGTAALDEFGWAMSSAGDVNGDGFSDVIVGAWQSSLGAQNAGTASVFHGSAMGLRRVADRVLVGSGSMRFGYSVSSAGDVDADGFDDVIVGAIFGETMGGPSQSGLAQVFHGSAMGVTMMPAQTLVGVGVGNRFGNSVATLGDVNGDGFDDVVVGAPYAAPGGQVAAGTASIFHGTAMGIPAAPTSVRAGIAGDLLGVSVAGAGDVNGDGFADLIAGSNYANPGGRMRAGTASVFLSNGMGIAMLAARVVEGDRPNDQLGHSVAALALPCRRNGAFVGASARVPSQRGRTTPSS